MLCLVAQLCPTLCDPVDCSLPGSSVHGDSPGKNTRVGCHALLQGSFPTQGSNSGLLHCRWILYHLSHQGSPIILEWVAYPFSRGSSLRRNQTGVSLMRKTALPQGGNMSRSPSQEDSLKSQAQLLMNIDREKKKKSHVSLILRHTIHLIESRERKGFPGGSAVKNPPANTRDSSSIPGSGRSPGEGNGNPLQYSCLENPMDRGT